MITDATLDDQLIKILKRIDTVIEQAEGRPLHSQKEQAQLKPRPLVHPTPGEWRQRVEAAILRFPDMKTAALAEIADVTGQTIRTYRKRMKAEGRIT